MTAKGLVSPRGDQPFLVCAERTSAAKKVFVKPSTKQSIVFIILNFYHRKTIFV